MQQIDAPKTMNDDDDPLAPARGIIFAVGTSIALGILVGLWLWLT